MYSFSVSLFPSSCAILSRIDHARPWITSSLDPSASLCEREKFFIIPLNPIYDQVDVTPLRMRTIIFIKLADFLILRLPFFTTFMKHVCPFGSLRIKTLPSRHSFSFLIAMWNLTCFLQETAKFIMSTF